MITKDDIHVVDHTQYDVPIHTSIDKTKTHTCILEYKRIGRMIIIVSVGYTVNEIEL
jgi:hypothetical protein